MLKASARDRYVRLEEIENNSLAASAYDVGGKEAFFSCKAAFNVFGLPIPKYGAHLPYPNSHRFYLTDYGLVGGLVLRKLNPLHVVAERLGLIDTATSPVFDAAFVETDDVLQPLLQVRLSKNAWLEINAGISSITHKETGHVQAVKHNLEEQGLVLLKESYQAVGQIPDAEGGGRWIGLKNRRGFIVKDRTLIQEETVRLDRIHGELRHDFTQAWKSQSRDQFEWVLKKCAQIVAMPINHPRRVLSAYWAEEQADTYDDYQKAQAAKVYRRQCAIHAKFGS